MHNYGKNAAFVFTPPGEDDRGLDLEYRANTEPCRQVASVQESVDCRIGALESLGKLRKYVSSVEAAQR